MKPMFKPEDVNVEMKYLTGLYVPEFTIHDKKVIVEYPVQHNAKHGDFYATINPYRFDMAVIDTAVRSECDNGTFRYAPEQALAAVRQGYDDAISVPGPVNGTRRGEFIRVMKFTDLDAGERVRKKTISQFKNAKVCSGLLICGYGSSIQIRKYHVIGETDSDDMSFYRSQIDDVEHIRSLHIDRCAKLIEDLTTSDGCLLYRSDEWFYDNCAYITRMLYFEFLKRTKLEPRKSPSALCLKKMSMDEIVKALESMFVRTNFFEEGTYECDCSC